MPIAISKVAAGGVSFPFGVSVAPTQASASEGSVMVGNRVMFANTARDTDFIAEPLPGGTGAELSWQLRSERSPEENALSFKLPSGASLQMSAKISGGAEVLMEGRPLLLIAPASAEGADGRSMPVTYTVSGHTLTAHVNLSTNVDFPVMVDPEVLGYYGEGVGVPSWPNWDQYTNYGGNCSNAPGFCFMPYPNLIQVGTNPGAPINAYGEWYTGVASSNAASITRVDLTGAIHEPANQSSFQAGISESNGKDIYSYNGFAGASGEGRLVTAEGFSARSIAFCAEAGGGNDYNDPWPLCDEADGGKSFFFLDDLWESQTVYNYARISTAIVHYIQTQPPSLSLEGTDVPSGWISSRNPPYMRVEGKDSGLGIAAVGVDAIAGERSPEYMEQHVGSSPAPGFPTYNPGCNDPFCAEWAWAAHYISSSQLSTGTWTLGAWTRNAVGEVAEKDYTIHVDNAPPEIQTPAWAGATYGDGSYPLAFSAQDGSASAPQSGVRSIELFVDGRELEKDVTECPEPEGSHLIPSASCFGLSGSWTLDGEDFGAGPHTVILRAEDWVENVSERSFTITINHPVDETQQLGPGTLNLVTGDYKLGATDVSMPAGTASLSVARSYDSQSSASGPLGPGWLLSTPDTSAAGQWQSLQPLPDGVEAMTTSGQKVVFTDSGDGYTSPSGYQTYTLTKPTESPVTYQITDSAGDYTQFTEPSGAD